MISKKRKKEKKKRYTHPAITRHSAKGQWKDFHTIHNEQGFQKDESDAPAFPIFASEDLGIGAIIVISPRKTTCFFATFSHFLHPLILVQDSSLPPGPPSPSTRMMSLF
ncbi:hypothetical protein I7I50_00447 [Histoplasma capsulatum G186AR]|uniref:Uncharacterized protein n=1 Tax=Ajellomyces capsulatus TaxID=5037 RepID=A0A8H7YIZ5_AJECA|nr:hypothetical protein I7I52_07715 [Histoplasma capsulatum]QSS72565.1 hypothetical protein I7I50_00447 [Histoplasma capsulatum G186AR]